jgi:hypothetical protein
LKHKFVVVLVTRDKRSDIKDSESDTRKAAEKILAAQLADMSDYMSSFYLTIEERWSLK